MDVLDQVCIALGLSDEQCAIIREAAEQICKAKASKKRKPSEYNVFIGECVKQESGPVTERFKRCVLKWKQKKKLKK